MVQTMTGMEETIAGTSSRSLLASFLTRVRDGNDEAFGALLRETRPIVYRWAYVKTADADDEENVTQRVLIRVHERIRDFEGRSSYTSWLYRITANAAAELHRTRGMFDRSRRRFGALGRPTSIETDMLQAIDDQRVRDVIHSIVRGLPERQRTALDLIDLQGFTPAEAAEMESMNATTMRVHLMRARRTVRSQIIESTGETEEETSHDQ